MPKATTRPSSRQDERVMVFIDGSNLYHVLGQTCGRHDLQFDKFAQKLANGRDLRRVYYYNIRQEAFEDRSNATDQDKFLSSLYDTPYLEVKLGIWKQRGATMASCRTFPAYMTRGQADIPHRIPGMRPAQPNSWRH